MTNNNSLLNLLSNYRQNPLFQRAQQMVQNNNSETQLWQIAENICREKGVDLHAAVQQYQQVQSMFKR